VTGSASNSSAARPVRRANAQGAIADPTPDDVAVEEPLEIRVSAEPLAVTMRTPGQDLDLAVGFLFAEGLLRSASDIGSVAHCGRPGDEAYGNIVEVTPAPGVHLEVERVEATRRGTLTTAACGVCGRKSVDDLMARLGQVHSAVAVSLRTVLDAANSLGQKQPVFAKTGGTHAAAILDSSGAVLALAEDVGRHNAVDKAVGALVRSAAIASVPPLGSRPARSGPAPAILVVSGRASFEIVQKAAAAQIPVVCAVGAASSLAVDLAERAGISLCAFARPGGFNVYSRPERICA
jgi:FdhD protein